MEHVLKSAFTTVLTRAGAAALLAVVGVASLAPPLGVATATVAEAAPEVTKLDFWAVRDAQESAAIALASEKGFFKDEGLDVTIKWIVSGTDTPSLAASGQIVLTGESAYIAGVLRDKGVDMRYLMPLSNIGGAQMVVLGPNTVVKSPKDLEGKKIGMAAGAGVGMAITSMCEDKGVDCSKIKLVNLQPPDQIPALLRGDIDAMAIWNPYALAGVKAGGRIYFTGNKSFIDGQEKTVDYMYLDGGLIVNGAFMAKNPETVKAVMRALIKATDYINGHSPKEVAAILTGPLDIPADDLEKIIKFNIYANAVDGPTVAKLTKLLAYGGRPDIGWTSKVYVPSDVYDLHLLKEVAPNLVTANGF
ncbi:NitT/TauT family transport system substrate-binding protein [Roseiarcus fermentans]|uniref:NitT/TauT family transport system substrate-binding protein n=1 Tax=Roseiarcus fermentans TaxID=1473586 RepID=A0A366EMK1_9HYPH|nr:ABC transporter substrate-binding protein [Roseiarcus fermentans]RBP02685.1 NitT/TauT family transport system substrate-binding protein [Roseiarcus fermentans]